MTVDYPFVSVLIPIRNEANFIGTSLRAVLAQDYPSECMEIILADGLSSDGTREIVRSMQIRHPTLRLIDNPGGIVSTGLNSAIRMAKGEIVIRVDGHCVVSPDYVRRCVKQLLETGADNVGGLQRAIGQGWAGLATALATSSPFGVGGARFHYEEKPGWVDTVYLGAYRREVFDRIGGFDEELVRNQDDEFNFRLIQSGGKIWLDPSIRSIYYSRANLRSLWKQYFEYGLYKLRVIQKRKAIPSWRHLVPATFVLALLVTFVLASLTGQALWALVIAGPYVAANLIASLWTARSDWNTLPLLPLAFLTLHLSYGIGFLWGLWKWRKYGLQIHEMGWK